VLRRIRERVGSDLAIEYRMCGSELIPGGLTTEDAVAFARMIEGEVDCIQVSTGVFAAPSTIPYFHPPTYLPHGLSVSYAARIKEVVGIPVATVGAHVDATEAEAVLREGKADLVAMARGLIADPAFPAKTQTGETGQVIPCIRCNECLGHVANFLPLRCAVNPVTGRETEVRTAPPARKGRDVLVVGGGPAGLQAATVAASRGHRVTLFEQSQKLGGNLAVAAVPDFKDDLKKYLVYLEEAVSRQGVDVRLGVEATPELVRDVAPEVLVLATGAEPAVPDIPGADGANVFWAGAALASPAKVGGRVLVLGGGLVGCETALFLARKGKKVTVARRGDQFAPDMNEISRGLLLELLAKEGVELRGGVTVEEIQEDGALVLDKASGSGRIGADTVVLAIGLRPRLEAVQSLGALAPSVHVVGDCVRPRKLIDATREAFYAAVEI
jgi:NADPH-dependent 2,4-dienoyl-CoA reductase/sulfur reductase-like enzyme